MSETIAAHSRNQGGHLRGLDGIRGLAILMVMLSHFIVVGKNFEAGNPFHRLLQSGYLGVDLFFALSGFLITGILIDGRHKNRFFRVFYWRRSLRIFPLYYGVLALSWLSVIWFSPQDRVALQGIDSPAWFWAYASNIGMACKGGWLESPTWIGLGHFWSLAVEEQFYLVWPLLVFYLPVKWLERLCMVLVASSPFVYQGLIEWLGSTGAYASTLSRLGVLAAGAWLAILWRKEDVWRAISPWFVRIGLTAGVLLLFERTYFANLSGTEPSLVLILGAAFIGLAVNANGVLSKPFFESRLLCWFGKYSYGIYVYHHALKPVWIHFLWDKSIVPFFGGGWVGTGVYTAAATALSLGLAWMSWQFFEAPILSLKSRFTHQRDPA